MAAFGIAIAAAGLTTPIGGWVQSLFFGSGVRWENAYSVLGSSALDSTGDAGERERRLAAWALVEGDRPTGGQLDKRIHDAGTLARLRYETLDEEGERMDEWQVRALVPSLGNGEDSIWRERCPQACRDEIAHSGDMRLARSGEPGIADEWVLRMPVGQTFALGSRTLVTQDIMDAAPRRISLSFVRKDGHTLRRPADIRVTLIEVCAADVRIGSLTRLEFESRLPTPRGFATSRWVQMNRCGTLERLPPAASPPSGAEITGGGPDLPAKRALRPAEIR